MNKKAISVIMGVHNIDKFLDIAIKSILEQTHKEFEFIIVANGSKYMEIYEYLIKNYSYDERIVVLKSPIGQLAHALNVGLDHAKYDYIARMDSDDISHPQRLTKQYNFLKENNLDMVGTSLEYIDKNGKYLKKHFYPNGKQIEKLIFFKNCFAHNTIIYKKSLILKARGYNSGFNSEDYDLWLRLRRMGVKWDNMQEELVSYRIHEEASQRNILGYAEVAGYMMREFVLSKNPLWLLSSFITIGKSLTRGR